MIKLVASDLDGTLLDNSHSVPLSNLKAIDELQKTDIPLVVCTGKTYALSKDFCKNIKAQYGIFGNGNHIINLKTGEEISKKILNYQDLINCFSILENYNLHIHAYTEDSIITPKLMFMDMRNNVLFSDKITFNIVDNVSNYILSNNISVLKLVVSSTDSLLQIKEKLEKMNNLTVNHIVKRGIYKDKVINKEYEYLDISPVNVSKGSALTQLSNYLNLEKENILSIGDNVNDITMFKSSGIGVAVGNAYEEVKKVADYTTFNSADNGAFAEAIYKYIE